MSEGDLICGECGAGLTSTGIEQDEGSPIYRETFECDAGHVTTVHTAGDMPDVEPTPTPPEPEEPVVEEPVDG